MTDNEQYNPGEGSLTISIELNDGNIAGISAQDGQGRSFSVGLVFKSIPESGGCWVCRLIGGRMVCQTVPCNTLTGGQGS